MATHSARRLQAEYLNEGGRRIHNLTIEQERQLPAQFRARAKEAGMLAVRRIWATAEIIGYLVPKRTFYRMLARHGWRKIRPAVTLGQPTAATSLQENSPGLSPKSSAKKLERSGIKLVPPSMNRMCSLKSQCQIPSGVSPQPTTLPPAQHKSLHERQRFQPLSSPGPMLPANWRHRLALR